MKLSIVYLSNLDRPWLLRREHGEYSQHAHFYTKKEALCCRKLIDACKYPREEKYRIAMQRLLTEEEYKRLNKKPRFYKKNCGVRR
jgi:hypothetical protein|nr:MAG TPA: hypothetical protein [Caudoviricetes sp.]